MDRLSAFYKNELRAKLQKDLGLHNVMEIPRIVKIVVNMGLGEAIQNPKILESAVDELARITGQKAVITRAKKSIATYKLREGMEPRRKAATGLSEERSDERGKRLER